MFTERDETLVDMTSLEALSSSTSPRPAAATPVGAIADDVSRALSEFFDERQRKAATHSEAFGELWAQLRHATDGGKRIRPNLVIATHRELGGHQHRPVIAVATAFELLHTAFLLHDDVIDGDTVRRGRANLIGAWSRDAMSAGLSAPAATAWGEAAGILAGDLLIHSAQTRVARADIPREIRNRILDLLDDAVFTTASGELDDVALTLGVAAPSISTVLSMTTRKTAHYSFRAPLQAGAILAGADAAVLAALDDYGHHAGIAFQLRDDLLGVFGSAEATGKSTSSDLDRATMTPLLAFALRTSARDELADLLAGGCADAVAADRVRHLLAETGAGEYVRDLLEQHVIAAIDTARSGTLPTSLGEYLVDVARSCGERSW